MKDYKSIIENLDGIDNFRKNKSPLSKNSGKSSSLAIINENVLSFKFNSKSNDPVVQISNVVEKIGILIKDTYSNSSKIISDLKTVQSQNNFETILEESTKKLDILNDSSIFDQCCNLIKSQTINIAGVIEAIEIGVNEKLCDVRNLIVKLENTVQFLDTKKKLFTNSQ